MREPPPNHRTHMFRHGRWVKRHIPSQMPDPFAFRNEEVERPPQESLYSRTTQESNNVLFYGTVIIFTAIAIVGIIGYYTGAF